MRTMGNRTAVNNSILTSILCKIGFCGVPIGYPSWVIGLGWVMKAGPKTHLGWVLGPDLGPKLGFAEAYIQLRSS
jgi:hypothetical protein